MKYRLILIFCLFLNLTGCSYKRNITAENIQLSPLYSSGMVMQAGPNAIIKGNADQGSVLAVKIMEYIKVVNADSQGKWEAVFPEIVLKRPFDVTVEGKDTVITLHNVRAGKVVIILGDAGLNFFDSNRDTVCKYADSLSNSSLWKFRPAGIEKNNHNVSLTGNWTSVNNSNAINQSCTAVKWVYKSVGKSRIPVGIIDVTWPGARLNAWLTNAAMKFAPDTINYHTQNPGKNISFNKSLADSIVSLKNSAYNGVTTGATRIWFNDENWFMTDLPVDFSNKKIPQNKKIIYLRKKIYISSRYLTSDFTINLGYINGDVEFYFNQQKIDPVITDGYYQLTIADTLLHEWSNLLCIRLFCGIEHCGIYGPMLNCYNADSTFYSNLKQEWKYNYNPEPDFPEFTTITSETGILYKNLITAIKDYPVDELIWYGGYFNIEDPDIVSEATKEILSYFNQVSQITILIKSPSPLDSIIYGEKTDIFRHELMQTAESTGAKQIIF